MSELRHTCETLFSMKHKLNSVKINLMHFLVTIENHSFEKETWETVNIRDFNSMLKYSHEYEMARGRNSELIMRYNVFKFYWHHLIDLYTREDMPWIRDNLSFLRESIDHIQPVIDLVTEEYHRLEHHLH